MTFPKISTTKIRAVVTALTGRIKTGTLDVRAVSETLTDIVGGRDADGAWDWRLAHDLVQIAAGRVAGVDYARGDATLSQLGALMESLPTETRRSERQVQLQQFSTPLDLGFLVGVAAQIQPGDVVLEPSAGTGTLAVMAEAGGATVLLNELDPQRRMLLAATRRQAVTGHDAEFIADLLDGDAAPGVVLMNPPFASSSTRNDPCMALRHVLSAAKVLRPGGRLVAIVPPSLPGAEGRRLWSRICALASPVFRMHLPRTGFRKMGASVRTDLLVLDKGGEGQGDEIPALSCVDAGMGLALLQDKCPPRGRLSPAKKDVVRKRTAPTAQARPVSESAPDTTRRRKMLLPSATRTRADARTPLAVTVFDRPRVNAPVSDIYARYAPQRVEIEGAQAHPSPMVESLAMGSVHPPAPGEASVALPRRLVTEGVLSEAQLETILMAESAFAGDLPGRFVRDGNGLLRRNDEAANAIALRRGFFLGDGTGCGKGRQVAGTILTGWLAGRRKAVWVSRSATLVEDAIRDWTDIGGSPGDIQPLSRWKVDEEIALSQGILFVTYATLRAVSRTGARRLDQVLRWLGDGFEGVIAFDEAHAMRNAGGESGGRGKKAASQQGLAGLQLQTALPRARVLYVSATGATEVGNLAYAGRLGLWGPGPDYPFSARDSFVSAMEAGGVAAMEVVARDLKALGLYTARALSFEGVEYDILEHALTPDQVMVYDAYSSAFKVIHTNLQAALEASGITGGGDRGKDAASAAGAAKSAAISAFESTKQRFFSHLLQGFKASTLIGAIRQDIAEGWAPVVQIVSTGEALLKRRLESLAPEDDLTEAALTPKDYVVTYLERAFPIQQMVMVAQEDGSTVAQPLRDADGRPVISREAEALRDAALEEILLLAPVPSALDQIVWAFGTDAVAEVTGRSQRPVKDGSGSLRIERRSARANAAETTAFMAGDKALLIFSDAGGTGRSYHAAQTAGNRKRRRHYLLEPGWRADAAIQGLGRTHRAAQVSAPFFRVCTSDVHGEKRFTSTIARRLDTLGALTRGQRETASQGLFRASDNLESPIARGCLRGLYADIVRGAVPAMSFEMFTGWTGLKLVTREGMLLDELPPIQRFLNRVLALPIALQNALFAEFMTRIEEATERARAAGTLDVGLETLRGDRITTGVAQPLQTCARTGAVTSLVPVTVERDLTHPEAEEVLSRHPQLVAMRNATSGGVALIAARPRQAHDGDGGIVLERRLVRPGKTGFMSEAAFGRSGWEKIDTATFQSLWAAEVAQLPATEVRDLHILTGLILPIWQRIPGENTRIYRVQPDQGEALLGRALGAGEAAALRGRFMESAGATPEELLSIVMDTDRTVELPGGLTLCRRRVAGHMRLELTGVGRDNLAWLKGLGCFSEIHQYQLRVFMPSAPDEAGLRIVTAICGAGEGQEGQLAAE